MAKYLLESLVQSGSSVRLDVKPVSVRRGTKYLADVQPPPVSANPCLFPARVEELNPERRPNHAINFRMGQAALGAGRSLGYTGSRSAARSAARAVLSRKARTIGGCKPMNAKLLSLDAYRSASRGSGIPGCTTGSTGWTSAATWATATR